MIRNHRTWLRRHFLKLDRSMLSEEGDDDFDLPTDSEMPLARRIETPLSAGLPLKPGWFCIIVSMSAVTVLRD